MKHGDVVLAEDIAYAVTRGPLRYADGATQTFDPAGGTVYVEYGRSTRGEWYLDATGRFCSFWPPSYRACYDVRWIVEETILLLGSASGMGPTPPKGDTRRPCSTSL